MSNDDCPGEGKCHGCASWCDRCGDIRFVCDSDDQEHGRGGTKCNAHRCDRCCKLLVSEDDRDGQEWKPWCLACRYLCLRCRTPVSVTWTYCDGCRRTGQIERLERELEAEAAYGVPELGQAERCARLADRIKQLTAESP